MIGKVSQPPRERQIPAVRIGNIYRDKTLPEWLDVEIELPHSGMPISRPIMTYKGRVKRHRLRDGLIAIEESRSPADREARTLELIHDAFPPTLSMRWRGSPAEHFAQGEPSTRRAVIEGFLAAGAAIAIRGSR